MTFRRIMLTRPPLLAAIVVVALAAALTYLGLAEKQYEASAKIQVSPVPREDDTFAGFGIFRESAGETSAAETAADLVETSIVSAAVAVRLRADRDELLDAVTAEGSGSSNAVTVRARADAPRRAAQIANAFADEFVSQRAARFQADLGRTIERLRERLRNVPATRRDEPPAQQLVERLAALEGYVGEPDPTLAVVSDAVASRKHVWPRTLPVLGVALGASLLAALGLALALSLFGRRRREWAPFLVAPEGIALRNEELARREAQLEERVRQAGRRESELAKRAGDLAVRERELEDRKDRDAVREREQAEQDAALAERESELRAREEGAAAQPEPEPASEPEIVELVAPPAPAAAVSGVANLVTLEHLVAEHGAKFPDRIDEWQAYLFHLRSHANNEGGLPKSFDALVDDVFGDLLER